MDNKELIFAAKLKEVKQLAARQSYTISQEQLDEAFAELQLENRQMELVIDYLKKNKIGIGEPADPEEYLTSEEMDYLATYLEELKELKSCEGAEKEKLLKLAMAGDKEAQNALTCAYLPQVAEIARLYTGQGVLLEDLIGEGNVAVAVGVTMLGCLEEASEADQMMAGLIMGGMEELIESTQQLKQQDDEAARKVNRVAAEAGKLAEELGREITLEELFAETELSVEEIEEAMELCGGQMEYMKKEQAEA